MGLTADDLAARHLSRPDRWFELVLGASCGLLAAGMARVRSGEFAVYRLSGTSRADLARLIVIEQLLVAGISVAVVAATVPFVVDHLVSPSATVLRASAGGLAWVLVAAGASVPEVLRNPLSPVTAA